MKERKTMRKIILIILAIALISIIGCTPKPAQPILIDIKGEVLEINEQGSSILVDSTADMVKGLIWIRITDDTKFADDVSKDFLVGNYVEIAADGAIAESYPMQAKAAAVYMNRAE